jgi:hypothetical protein
VSLTSTVTAILSIADASAISTSVRRNGAGFFTNAGYKKIQTAQDNPPSSTKYIYSTNYCCMKHCPSRIISSAFKMHPCLLAFFNGDSSFQSTAVNSHYCWPAFI